MYLLFLGISQHRTSSVSIRLQWPPSLSTCWVASVWVPGHVFDEVLGSQGASPAGSSGGRSSFGYVAEETKYGKLCADYLQHVKTG